MARLSGMTLRVIFTSYNRSSMALPLRLAALTLFPALLAAARAQTLPHTVTLPAGTPIAVSISDHRPMRAGESLITRTLYPIYAANILVLPAGTAVTGTVISLHPNHAARIDARLGGDFTPLRQPVVRFTALVLPSGETIRITTGTATDGAPIYQVVAPPPRQGGLVRQGYNRLRQRARDTVAVATGPDKADRAKQFLYSQLPYHPQRIQKGTSWTVETDAPITFTENVPPASPVAKTVPEATPPTTSHSDPARPGSAPDPKPWIVKAYLVHSITSATAQPGQPIRATVAEPIFDRDGNLAVPQGSMLSGTITQARHSRSFGRAARLRFRFTQLTSPDQAAQAVRTSLTQVDSNTPNSLVMTREGEVKPKPRDKIAIPLLLAALAAQPFDQEHGHDQLRKAGEASNSLGILGFIVGTAAQQANVAAGIGFYGAALSLYQRLIRRGPEVAFARDTRIVLQTIPTTNTPLH